MRQRSALVDEVLAGGRRELRLLAARGVLPLPIHELIEVQVSLTGDDDEEVAAIAEASLASLDPKIAASVLGEAPVEAVVRYLATRLSHPLVVEAVLRVRSAPLDLLEAMAPRLATEMQESLLLRQDAIVQRPSILDALETNRELSPFARRRIREYREHLLPRQRREPETPEEIERAAEDLSEADVEAAIAEAAAEPVREGQLDEMTGLSETQLRTLPIPVRLKLARGAPRTLRSMLVRDTNPLVATSVLKFNPVTESEIEEIAVNRSVRGEVLQIIAANRTWMRRYSVVHSLVRNPRTPSAVAVRLLSRLNLFDLKRAGTDHNIPHAVRSAASRLYTIKRT